MKTMDSKRRAKVISEAFEAGEINSETEKLDLFDFDYVQKRINEFKTVFPESFVKNLYCLKVNSFSKVAKIFIENGMGVECGSIPEVKHALRLGATPHDVAFYSPCRSRAHFKEALSLGVSQNLDNEYDMEIVDGLLAEQNNPIPFIGLRINPVVASGAIKSTSTATRASKFGHPVTSETKDKVIELFAKYDWLRGLHVHVGSQGVSLDSLVQAVKTMADLAEDIEAKTGRAITTLNLGGGLSSSYDSDTDPVEYSFANYRKRLDSEIPSLFSGKYELKTEFGRCLTMKAGLSLTRIEAVKAWLPDINPRLMTHLGAQQLPWPVYFPDNWKHRFEVYSNDGKLKSVEDGTQNYDLAGPLGFQGDFLAKNIELPMHVESGDWLAVLDTGAYAASMHSRFHSLAPTAIVGFSNADGDKFEFSVIKGVESMDRYLGFYDP